MLSTDELVRGVMAGDAVLRVGYARDCELDVGEEEDEEPSEPFACDWGEFKRAAEGMRAAYASDDDTATLINLDALDEFVRHFMCRRYPGLYEAEVPVVLLGLATHESPEIREVALICLTNLSALVPDFVESLSGDAVARVLPANADDEFAGHLFRFVSNVIQKNPRAWGTLDLDTLCRAAASHCARGADTAVQYMWYRVTQQCAMSLGLAERCVSFVTEFFKRHSNKGLVFVYLAIHNILNSIDIPFECRIQIAERLFLCEIIDDALRKVDKGTLTPTLAALYGILGDLFALQLTQSTIFLSHHLDLLHSVNPLQTPMVTVNWCEIEIYWAILKVAENSDARTLQDLLRWRNRMLATDLAMKANDGPGVLRFLALKCLTFCLDNITSEELIMTISGSVMTQLIIAATKLHQISAADVLLRIVRCVVDYGTKELFDNITESFRRCGGLGSLTAECEVSVKERFDKISSIIASSPLSQR